MAVIKGVKERVHLPLYDSIFVKPTERFGDIQSSNIIRFFQDVTGKTKLQTNMQASSLLPHWNTFEARAMRVVISDLPAQYPAKPEIPLMLTRVDADGAAVPDDQGNTEVTVERFTLTHYVDFKRRVEGPEGQAALLTEQDLLDRGLTVTPSVPAGNFVLIDRAALKRAADQFRQILPPDLQIFPNNGQGTLIGKIVYNTVTTFYVGEKIMIQMPTWFFPAGAGPYSENGAVTTHGYPSPQATFRFADPISIDTQQNFRVEIEIPENDVLGQVQQLYGPLFFWIVIDGYMTRDVQ